ncbi:MAG: PH domain-containing protein [Eggerthellaceae bacterium]|nr:PH domain-containing protein [Eggerthellaceae bacterium]
MELNQIDPLAQVNGVFAGDTAPAGTVQDFSGPRKVHHSYIWLGSLRILFYIFVLMLISILPNIMSSLEGMVGDLSRSVGLILLITVGMLVVLYGLILLIRRLQFKFLTFQLTADEFVVHSGIITKRHAQIPYQRIQAIDQQASLMQWLAGVCTLKISTAGGASNRAVLLEYLLNADAQALREELFARKQWQLAVAAGQVPAGVPYGAAPVAYGGDSALGYGETAGQEPVAGAVAGVAAAGAAAGMAGAAGSMKEAFGYGRAATAYRPVYQEAPVTYAFGLSNKELILAGVSNNTSFWAIVVAIIGAISQIVSLIIPASLIGGGGAVSGAVIGNTIASVLGVALLTWAISALATCLGYGGFSCKRQGTRIEVQRGLIQRVYQGVDIDRVQSVYVKQGFIRRLMGYCEISLGKIESGQRESGQQNSQVATGIVVHPFVKVNLVPQVIAGLVPEMAWVPEPQRRVAKVAKRRMFVRRLTWAGGGFWLAVFIGLGLLFWGQAVRGTSGGNAFFAMCIIGLVIALAIAALQIWDGILWYRESFFAYDRRGMMVRNGGFHTETVVIPRGKIQFAALQDNPFQRRVDVSTLIVRTAAGIGGTTSALRNVANPEAVAWYDWTRPGGAAGI